MFKTIEDFMTEFSNEAAATRRLMACLTDKSLNQPIGPNHRTLGRLAWHLVTTLHEMPSLTGLRIPSAGDDQLVPASAAAIAEAYYTTQQALLDAVRTQWTDESLAVLSNMYGEMWPNGLSLRLLIQHEIHHRGQMTVLIRQAGIRVPDIYGPVYEDWAERGMKAPAV